jgi:hypothetical protein
LVNRLASASPAFNSGERAEDAVQKALPDFAVQAQAGREGDGCFKFGAGELGWGFGDWHGQADRWMMLIGTGR